MQAMSLPLSSGLESGPLSSSSAAPRATAPGANAAEIGAFVAALLTQATVTEVPTGAAAPAVAAASDGRVENATSGAPLPGEGQSFAALVPAFALLNPAEPAQQAAPGVAAQLAPFTAGAAARPATVTGERALRTPALPIGGDGKPDLAPLSTNRPSPEALVNALIKGAEIVPAAIDPQNSASADTVDARSAVQAAARGPETTSASAAYAGKATVLPAQQPDVFSERLNQHIAVMVSSNAQHARIAVNPAELGPVEVRVSVIGDEATVHLAAPTAATRELLEEALPRLRAAFADSGIALGNAGVFTQMPDRGSSGAGPGTDGVPGAGEALMEEAGATPLRVVRLGLVDAFV